MFRKLFLLLTVVMARTCSPDIGLENLPAAPLLSILDYRSLSRLSTTCEYWRQHITQEIIKESQKLEIPRKEPDNLSTPIGHADVLQKRAEHLQAQRDKIPNPVTVLIQTRHEDGSEIEHQFTMPARQTREEVRKIYDRDIKTRDRGWWVLDEEGQCITGALGFKRFYDKLISISNNNSEGDIKFKLVREKNWGQILLRQLNGLRLNSVIAGEHGGNRQFVDNCLWVSVVNAPVQVYGDRTTLGEEVSLENLEEFFAAGFILYTTLFTPECENPLPDGEVYFSLWLLPGHITPKNACRALGISDLSSWSARNLLVNQNNPRDCKPWKTHSPEHI